MMVVSELLTRENVDKVSDIPHMVSVHEGVQTQYTSDDLESAAEQGRAGG